jgi:undecaprenyl-diphosphatase
VWISKTGDGQLYVLIAGTLWWLEPQHGLLFLYSALLAYGLELPIYLLLKQVLKRQRPCDSSSKLDAHIVPSDKFSLPSGHTAAAFLMASLVSHFYPSIAVLVYAWAFMIGCSRVFLGVHYPGDIVAGAVLGLGVSTMSLSFL